MPTYERLARFRREYSQLSPELRAAFLEALAQFIVDADLALIHRFAVGFCPGCEVK